MIAYDATSKSTFTTNPSWSHTTSGSDRILIVLAGAVSDNISGITYNGVSLTQITETTYPGSTYAGLSLWYLVNPASGSNTISVSSSSAVGCVAVSYTGVAQILPVDSSAVNNNATGTTALAVSTTVIASDCWLVGGASDSQGTGAGAGSGTTIRDYVANGVNYGDSNGTVGTGSQSLNYTFGTSSLFRGIIASIAPSVADGARLTAITGTQFLSSNAGSSLADISGNSRDLSASGTAVYENGFDGSTNTAYAMNASWFPYRSGSFGISNSTNCTIQFRVKIDSQPGANATFCLFNFLTNDAANSRLNIRVAYQDSSGTKRLSIRDTGGNTQTYNVTLTTGVWCDMAYVQDQTNSRMKLYFKGTNSPTLITAVDVADSTGNSGNAEGLQIGSETTGGPTLPESSNLGDFSIDNFRITNTARTQSEIESDFAPAPTTNVKTWDGVARANVKTLLGVASANIKSINGIE